MKTRLPFEVAAHLADRLRVGLELASNAFLRVSVAGSVRRRRPTVGDLEIVGEVDPAREFGADARIDAALRNLGVKRASPTVRKDGVSVSAPWGPRYRKCDWEYASGAHVQVDLFLVRPPAQWGTVFLIRTGSAEWSQAVVTRLHRFGLRSDGGRIVRVADGTTLDTPTEREVFEAAHLPYVPPFAREMDCLDTADLFQIDGANGGAP